MSICSTESFSLLPLKTPLLNNLASLGYEIMTPIQAKSLPHMLKGDDVIAKAKTGSGKTAAFGLSLLQRLYVDLFASQCMVLCPTRELAEQVSQEIRRLARLMPNVKVLNLSGGLPMKPQLDSLRHGVHVIVGTPGRILKHLNNGTLFLNKLHTLVLDEADRMLDMGFFDDIKNIISFCPKKRQTLLFSATYPPEIKGLSQQFMQNPQEVIIETAETEFDIDQQFYEVTSSAQKFPLLKALLMHYKPTSTLIFCNTKQQTVNLTDLLIHAGFSAAALNGDMEQADRNQVIIQFINQSICILVATDVAARGLDIKELPAVINYDIAFEPDVHIHRIGRTGRAGQKGLAFSLSLPADASRICLIEDNLSSPISWNTIDALDQSNTTIAQPAMQTLCINAGRKDKIRPGDILGALTKDAGLPVDVIGKIDIASISSYIAIRKSDADKAYRYLQNGKLKGRKVGVKKL